MAGRGGRRDFFAPGFCQGGQRRRVLVFRKTGQGGFLGPRQVSLEGDDAGGLRAVLA